MVVQDNRRESLDGLAITKAAAWAWYERGSWFEHKSIREIDCRRKSEYTRRPSRYKLEAMQKENQEPKPESESYDKSSLLFTARVSNSLLDVYEVERISRDLDCYVESSRIEYRRKSMDGGDRGSRRIGSLPEGVKVRSRSRSRGKSKSSRDKRKGFWFGRKVICGMGGDDVVNSNLLVKGR